MLAFFAIILGIVFFDQITKYLAVIFLKNDTPFVVIEGVLQFEYKENPGAAMGILQNDRWVFMTVSVIAIIAMIIYMIKYRPQSKVAYVAIAFMTGGGIANMIDRTILGYVIDFIDFCAFPKIWNFVFNVADSFVCVGAGLLMYYIVCETVKEAKAEKKEKALESTADNTNEETNDDVQ